MEGDLPASPSVLYLSNANGTKETAMTSEQRDFIRRQIDAQVRERSGARPDGTGECESTVQGRTKQSA